MLNKPQVLNKKISKEEWTEICLALEEYHAVFYQVWKMGRPLFTNDIPTAAVQFDKVGKYVIFLFNPEYWEKLSLYDRLFTICHEALHIILNHGIRCVDTVGINRGATNVALDIVVNHLLVRSFGFERAKIAGAENFCWVDTVFAKSKIIPGDDECFEQYYNRFDKVYGHGSWKKSQGFGTVDDHSFMSEDNSDNWDDFIDDLNESINEEEKASLKKIIEKNFQEKEDPEKKGSKPQETQKAGLGTGGWTFLGFKKVKKKKKWETIIKKWSWKYLKDSFKEKEQWARVSRRMSLMSSEMFLPSDMEEEELFMEKSKIEVYFFLDTSGSCYNLKDRFFEAALSLDEKKFKIRLFCFDTKVEETTLASRKIYGGGGTCFKILEEKVQSEINEGEKHPDAVFVITDGYGTNVNPQKPKNWHWFITEGGVRNCINADCNFYNLAEYE